MIFVSKEDVYLDLADWGAGQAGYDAWNIVRLGMSCFVLMLSFSMVSRYRILMLLPPSISKIKIDVLFGDKDHFHREAVWFEVVDLESP